MQAKLQRCVHVMHIFPGRREFRPLPEPPSRPPPPDHRRRWPSKSRENSLFARFSPLLFPFSALFLPLSFAPAQRCPALLSSPFSPKRNRRSLHSSNEITVQLGVTRYQFVWSMIFRGNIELFVDFCSILWNRRANRVELEVTTVT